MLVDQMIADEAADLHHALRHADAALERKLAFVPGRRGDAGRIHQPAFFIGVLRNSTKPGSASMRASQALTLA